MNLSDCNVITAKSPRDTTKIPKILCIENDPDLQSVIEMRMHRYNVELKHAYYGIQGILESVRGMPNLIILDIAMPYGDGRYVLRSLRSHKNTSHIPVIVLTSMGDPKVERDILTEGANVFLHKPINSNMLVKQINSYITLEDKTY